MHTERARIITSWGPGSDWLEDERSPQLVRRIPIRTKVAGALAVPLLGLVAAAGLGVSSSVSESRTVTRQAELATAAVGRAGLIGALQNERNLALVHLLGLSDRVDLEVTDADIARELTDGANTRLRHQSAGQPSLRSDYADALDSLSGLPTLRGRVDAALATGGAERRDVAHEVFVAYTALVSNVFAAHDRFTLELDDAGLRRGQDLVNYGSHASDAAAQLVELLLYVGGGPGGIDEPVEAAQLAELHRDLDRANAAIAAHGSGPYEAPAQDLLADPRVTGLPELAGGAVLAGGPVDPAAVVGVTPLGPGGGYAAFRDEVVGQLDAQAADLRDRADARRDRYLAGALVVVAAALAIAWLVSRSITRSLRDLSLQARAMSTYRLPAAVEDILGAPPGEDVTVPDAQPIVVGTRDEVADVARAFNDVQESAVGLAVEQAALRRNVAESYVNLGRRNQNLLGRLLDVVGDLEQGETDPERLGKLYRLDHLATRIRRNAESLLVLSQAESSTTARPPVDLAHIVRAALGEIENYERVLVRALDAVTVSGGASADLAHLLAELIENGLRHSPPRELVEVSGRVTDGGYEISIVDHGLGMSPEDIERANQRLAGAESFTVTPAKYLGHYVAAVLAARHDIKVRLQGSVVVGIAALVELPPSLLVSAPGPRADSGAVPALAAAPVDAPDPVPTAADTPTAEDVRSAVALLRTTGAEAHDRAAAASRAAGQATGRAVNVVTRAADIRGTGPGPRPSFGAVADLSGLVLPNGPVDAEAPPATPPGRTAHGLVRRVRGAHVPVGAAVARAGGPNGERASGAADESSSTPVDGAEIQRFLTSLVGGVQRSLDEQSPADIAGDEG